MLSRVCLSIQRFVLPCWVGAAVLFVFTSVAEQQSEHFRSSIKNLLALTRFPYYYGFGFLFMLTAIACSAGRWFSGDRSKTTLTVFGLLVVINVLMILDFQFVYQPLSEFMKDLLRPRDAEFTRYHQMSKYINSIEIILCTVAAVLVCREPRAQPIAGQTSPSAGLERH